MNHVGLSGTAHLAFMLLPRKAEGLFQWRQIVFRAIFADFGLQFAIQPFDWIGRRRVERDTLRGVYRFGGHSSSIVKQGGSVQPFSYQLPASSRCRLRRVSKSLRQRREDERDRLLF